MKEPYEYTNDPNIDPDPGCGRFRINIDGAESLLPNLQQESFALRAKRLKLQKSRLKLQELLLDTAEGARSVRESPPLSPIGSRLLCNCCKSIVVRKKNSKRI